MERPPRRRVTSSRENSTVEQETTKPATEKKLTGKPASKTIQKRQREQSTSGSDSCHSMDMQEAITDNSENQDNSL